MKHTPVLRQKSQTVDVDERNIGCLFGIHKTDVQAKTQCGQKTEFRITVYLVYRVTTVLLSVFEVSVTFA